MLELKFTAKLKKDFKKAKRLGYDLSKLHDALDTLCRQDALPASMRDHLLMGNYSGHRECHIELDWLLIYQIDVDTFFHTVDRVRITHFIR